MLALNVELHIVCALNAVGTKSKSINSLNEEILLRFWDLSLCFFLLARDYITSMKYYWEGELAWELLAIGGSLQEKQDDCLQLHKAWLQQFHVESVMQCFQKK